MIDIGELFSEGGWREPDVIKLVIAKAG